MAPDNEPMTSAEDTTSVQAEASSAQRPPSQVADDTPAAATPAAGENPPADAPAAEAPPAKRATRARKAASTTTKRAPRKATKKASAPASADEASTPDELGAPSTEVTDHDAQAAATALATDAETPSAQVSGEPERAAKAPAKKAAKRTRRATKKASAPETTTIEVEQPAAAATTAMSDDDARRAAELAAEIDADESDGEVSDLTLTVLSEDELDGLIATIPATPGEDEAPAATSAFGLLFQAPDPTTVRRHRRATSPSVDPSTVERDDADERDDATESSQGAREVDTDERESLEDDTKGSRRRRRGGKGRRKDATEDSGDESAAQEDTSDEGADDDASDDNDNDDETSGGSRRSRRRRGGRKGRSSGRSDEASEDDSSEGDSSDDNDSSDNDDEGSSSRRRRRRRRSGSGGDDAGDPPGTVTKVREPRRAEATGIKGSTRLEAKKQRRREGREAGRRRTIITEAEFLARREAVERTMVVRDSGDRTQIAVLEDGVLVEHYVSREQSASSTSIAGNIYLGRVQNVLPSMEAAFVDIGKGRNAVLYAGEVNWDAAGLENGQARRIENALKSGDSVLVQATKDPIGHKGARLTSQISLPGRYLVFVPGSSMTGISRKLPDTERARLKRILKEVMPSDAGVIVRTAAEGASEEELRADVARLTSMWDDIQAKSKARSTHAPALLHGEPDLTVRVIRDVFNEDFSKLVVSGESVWSTVSSYVESVAPDLAPRLERWTGEQDVFAGHRIDEQLAKAMDRKVWLPSGGSLVIDRTEAMTVIDVNTGKFVGQGGNLEETVTKNNIEAAEEIVRQLRLRDIGGIIVVDFIDMVLESNRDLVVRRLVECLGRDRTKHQVAEVTSLGLVQMTRKRVGTGLIESFSTTCEHCNGRGILISSTPAAPGTESGVDHGSDSGGRRGRGKGKGGSGHGSGGNASGQSQPQRAPEQPKTPVDDGTPTPAQIAAAAHAAALAASKAAEDEAPASPDEVARAIDEAMTTVLGDRPEPSAEASEQAEDSAQPTRTRAKGRKRAARREATAPAAVTPEITVPEAPVVAEASAVTEAQSATPVTQTREEEPTSGIRPQEQAGDEPVAVTPHRRKRGRVVAPAGPPKPVDAPQS